MRQRAAESRLGLQPQKSAIDLNWLLIFEDDAYADLCASPVTRLAAIDRLNLVIHAGSFSKTLAANIHVGFIACGSDLAAALVDTKILTGFATPELNEKLVHKLLLESRYDRHVGVLRERLAECRQAAAKTFGAAGIEIFGALADGMFFWVNARADTNELAVAWREEGLLLAPGSLFSPRQTPSSWMRFNVTTLQDDAVAVLLRSLRRRG